MKSGLLRRIIFVSCALIWLPAILCHGRRYVTLTGVPSLDEMAGDWLPMKNVANPSDVNNFHDMLLVNRDLTSFFCNPEDWLWAWGDERFRFGCPLVTADRLPGKE